MENLIGDEREYELSGFNKIFYSIIATGIFLFAIYLGSFKSPAGLVFSWIVVSFLILLSGLIIINVVRRKLVINKDGIIYTGLFSTSKLPLEAIRGCRVSSKIIVIESASVEYPRIYIGHYIDFANSTDIQKWLTENLKDLNAEDLATARHEMLENATLGNSPKEREQRYKRAKAVAIGYNIISVLTGFTLLFFSSTFSNITMLLLPWIGVLLLFSTKGLIKLFGESSRSIYPHIIIGIILPSFFLLMKSLKSYNLLSLEHIWLSALLATALIIVPLYLKGINPAAGNTIGQVIFMLVAVLIYGFGGARLANCAFDKHEAKLYQAAVLSRWRSTGKGKGFFIKLNHWGPQTKVTSLEISRQLYENIIKGDTVIVRLKPGVLQIPWYWVELREDNIIIERTGILPPEVGVPPTGSEVNYDTLIIQATK